MADIEKVIKGLETCYCRYAKCGDCPYHDLPDEESCNDTLCLDALALIDTQYKLILELQNLISTGTKMMNGDEA